MPWEEAQSPVFSWDPQGALPEPVVQAAREKAEMLSEAQAEDRQGGKYWPGMERQVIVQLPRPQHIEDHSGPMGTVAQQPPGKGRISSGHLSQLVYHWEFSYAAWVTFNITCSGLTAGLPGRGI